MVNQKYLIIKKKGTSEIIYYDINRENGYNFNPKTKIKDAINVDKMVVINPTLVEKIIEKKIKKKIEYLIKMLSIIYSMDDESGESLREALNETDKLKQEIINKYKNYLNTEKYNLIIKKINILEVEAKTRLNYMLAINKENRSRKSR